MPNVARSSETMCPRILILLAVRQQLAQTNFIGPCRPDARVGPSEKFRMPFCFRGPKGATVPKTVSLGVGVLKTESLWGGNHASSQRDCVVVPGPSTAKLSFNLGSPSKQKQHFQAEVGSGGPSYRTFWEVIDELLTNLNYGTEK